MPKGVRCLSNVIKKAGRPDKAVTVGSSPYSFPKIKKDNSPGRYKQTLNFNAGITSAIDEWRKKLEGKIVSLNESTDRKMDEVYQKGYEKGVSGGIDQEHTDRENFIGKYFAGQFKVVETLVNDTRKKNERAFQGLEEKIVILAAAIAEKIIKKNLEIDPSINVSIVSEALSYLISSEVITLKVSVDDYQPIKERYNQWLSMAGNVKEFNIEIDKRLIAGDCLIETDGGIIDATINSRLDLLVEELMKVNK